MSGTILHRGKPVDLDAAERCIKSVRATNAAIVVNLSRTYYSAVRMYRAAGYSDSNALDKALRLMNEALQPLPRR